VVAISTKAHGERFQEGSGWGHCSSSCMEFDHSLVDELGRTPLMHAVITSKPFGDFHRPTHNVVCRPKTFWPPLICGIRKEKLLYTMPVRVVAN